MLLPAPATRPSVCRLPSLLLPFPQALEVTFDTGERFRYPAEYLRVESTGAVKEGHIVHGRRHVGIMAIEPVGSYAVRLQFDDLDSSGIYTWQVSVLPTMLGKQRWASSPLLGTCPCFLFSALPVFHAPACDGNPRARSTCTSLEPTSSAACVTTSDSCGGMGSAATPPGCGGSRGPLCKV